MVSCKSLATTIVPPSLSRTLWGVNTANPTPALLSRVSPHAGIYPFGRLNLAWCPSRGKWPLMLILSLQQSSLLLRGDDTAPTPVLVVGLKVLLLTI